MKGWQNKSDRNDAAAEASSSFSSQRVSLSSIHLYHLGFCCTGGYSEKTEHLKVIENKVLNPSQMHDIQSVGHTWLLSDKTLQVQTVARALLHRWGTRRHFRCLSVLPNIGWAFDRGRERFALCVRPRTHDSILSGNLRVYTRSVPAGFTF